MIQFVIKLLIAGGGLAVLSWLFNRGIRSS